MNPSRSTREFLFLGTGTSVGVPVLGCQCRVCQSTDPKLHRTRSSALITSPAGRILIDTGPDLRQQFLRQRLSHADAVLMTHHHADHILGMDDLRMFSHYLGGRPVPVYCEPDVESVLRRVFSYAFDPRLVPHSKTSVPSIEFRQFERPQTAVLDQRIIPIPLMHGSMTTLGFRIDGLAYCTDVNHIPEASWELLAGVEILVIDALRLTPHPTHFSLSEALEVIERLQPRAAYLTHISCRLDPEEAKSQLPSHVALAYDGLSIAF